MAQDDIYGNKRRYKDTVENISVFASSPVERAKKQDHRSIGKYHCLNKKNMPLFQQLFRYFDAQDLSYVRRLRLIQSFKLVLAHTKKTLAEIDKKDDRAEIESIVGQARRVYSPKTIVDFIRDLKYLWKILFPARDAQGRIDETQMPYVVRSLAAKMDKSKERLRKDRLTVDEYMKIVDSFGDDVRVQFFIALAYESLGRPQEILNVRIKNVELFDNFAKVYAGQGKEGPGLLQCIDSYPYLVRLLETHPLRSEPEAFLFLNTGKTNRFQQMTPPNINKKLRERCKLLGIKKPVTCYSFKRNGVTDLRLRGETDKLIQERARWTSTKQLHTYDIASQEEAFMEQLVRRGRIKPDAKTKHLAPVTKNCPFCDAINPVTERTCYQCKRLLYREDIEAQQKQEESRIATLERQLSLITKGIEELGASRKKGRRTPTIPDLITIPQGLPESEKAKFVGEALEELDAQAAEHVRDEIQATAQRNGISEKDAAELLGYKKNH